MMTTYENEFLVTFVRASDHFTFFFPPEKNLNMDKSWQLADNSFDDSEIS